MLVVEGGQFTGLQQSATHWPDSLKQAAALCNSLTPVGKNQVVGDLADKQAFKAVEARFLVCNSVFHCWLERQPSQAVACMAFADEHASRVFKPASSHLLSCVQIACYL